ncbi:MAG: hypothetical protein ACYS8Y_12105 [Planctomycetota bacterium]
MQNDEDSKTFFPHKMRIYNTVFVNSYSLGIGPYVFVADRPETG